MPYMLSNGNWSQYPEQKNAAKFKSKYYDSLEKCPFCNVSTVRTVKGDRCKHCQHMASGALYNAVQFGNLDTYLFLDVETGRFFHTVYAGGEPRELPAEIALDAMAVWQDYQTDPDHFVSSPQLRPDGSFGTYSTVKPTSPRQTALLAGESHYTPDKPCPRCGQHSLKRVDNGECSGCVELAKITRAANKPVSPRKAAILAGEKWYTPTEPCPRCDQIAPRYVANGVCKGCQDAARNKPRRQKRGISPADRHAEQLGPDAVISRDNARLMGFLVFRTGKPCRVHKHTGFRYVSSGACVECKKLKGA